MNENHLEITTILKHSSQFKIDVAFHLLKRPARHVGGIRSILDVSMLVL